MADNQYLLNFLLKFDTVGLAGVGDAVAAEIERIKAAGATANTSAGDVQAEIRQTLAAAERETTEERKNRMADAKTRKERRDAATEAAAARRAISEMGKAENASLDPDVRTRLRAGVTKDQYYQMFGGTPSVAPSRFGGGTGGPGGPTGPIVPNQPDPDEAREIAQKRADALLLRNNVRAELLASDENTKQLVREAEQHKRAAAALNKQLAVSDEYLTAVRLDANAKRKRSTAENQALLKDPDYAANVGIDESIAARRRRAEQLSTQRYITPKDNREEGELQALRAAQKRAIELAKLQNQRRDGTARELAEIQKLTERQKREQQASYLRRTRGDIPDIARSQFEQQRRSADVGAELSKLRDPSTAKGRALADAEAATAIVEKRRATFIARNIAEQQASDSQYLTAKAATAKAEKERADRIKAAELGVQNATDPNKDIELVRAQSSVANRTRENLRATAAAKVAASSEADIRSSVNRRIAEQRLEGAIRQREKAYIQDALRTGQLQGTGFQKLQARFSARNATPEELPTLGQFVGQKALTAGAYAIAGTALYGSVTAIKQIVKEAEELDRVLNQVKAQFVSIGQGDQFEGFRESILEISKETGVAADEVATVAFQFKGAFGDSAEAVTNLRAAMQITTVTGLSLEEVVDSLTATSKTYGIGIDEIGDKAIGLEERFGVLSKQTITFTADLASTAQQAGLSFEKVAALGAVAQQVSGKSGSALAESFGRILPAIQDSGAEILRLYTTLNQQNAKVASTQTIADALGGGKTGVVFEQIVRDYDKLNQSQKNYVITLLGSRREAQSLIPVLQNSSKLIAEWDGKGGSDVGKLENRFEDLRETVQNTFARANELFKQFGTALFELGLADLFVKAGNAAAAFLTVITKIAQLIGALFNVPLLGPFLSQLLQISVIAVGVAKAYTLMTTAIAALGIGQKAAAIATVQEAEANQLQAATSAEATAALGGQTAAAGALTVANEGAAATTGFSSRASGLLVPTAAPPAAPVGRLASFQASALPPGRLGGAGGFKGLFTAGQAAPVSGAAAGAIGVAGAIVVLSAYMEERNKLEKQATDVREKLQKTDAAKLHRLAQATEVDQGFDTGTALKVGVLLGPVAGLLTKFGGTRLLGQDDPSVALIAQDNKNQTAKAEAIFDGLAERDKDRDQKLTTEFLKSVNSENRDNVLAHFKRGGKNDDFGIRKLLDKSFSGDEEAFAELRKRAKDGDVHAQEALAFLGDVADKSISTTANVKQTVDEILNQNDRKKRAEDVGGTDILSQLNIDTVQKLQQQGEATTADVLDVINSERDAQQQLFDAASATGDVENANKARAELNKIRDTQNQVEEDVRTKKNQLVAINRALSGTDTSANRFSDLLAQLDDPTLNSDQKIALNGSILDALKQKFQDSIERTGNHYNTAQEQLAIAEQNIEIPAAFRLNLTRESIKSDIEQNGLVGRVGSMLGIAYKDMFENVAQEVESDGKTVQEILRRALEGRVALLEGAIAELEASGADTRGQRKLLDEAKTALNDVNTKLADNPGGPAAKEMTNEEKATFDLRVKAAQELVQQAQAEADLFKAQNANNPFAAAAADMKAAQAQLVLAQLGGNKNEILAAETAIANAQRAGVEAQRDVSRATLEGASSIARNPISSTNAQIGIQRFELAVAQADGNIAGAIRATNQLNQLAIQQSENLVDIVRAGLEGNSNTGDPVHDTNAQIILQRFELAQAQQKGDQAAQIRAFNQINDLQRTQADNFAAIADSVDELEASRIRDPFAALTARIRIAERKVGRAKGEAERNAAIQELEGLRRDLADAFDQIVAAQVDVAVAMADSRGDHVGSAKLQLNEARRQLDRAIAEGAGGEEIARLRAAVIRSESAAADALFTSRMDDIDFMLEFGKITSRQAIALLEAMLAAPDVRQNQDKVRAIQRKIKSLQGDLSRDLQFNLPTALGLPTLYEARRVNQSSKAGIGYQDNRNVQVSITVNNAADLAAVRSMLDESVSAQTNRFASGGKKY